MILRTKPLTDINDITIGEIKYLFTILPEGKLVHLSELKILGYYIESFGHILIEKHIDVNIDFSIFSFYELKLILNYINKINIGKIKQLFEMKLFDYIKNNLNMIPKFKYIKVDVSKINKSYYMLTSLNYDSIKRFDIIKGESIEYYIAEYDELGRLGNQYTFYPNRCYNTSYYYDRWGHRQDIWKSAFANTANENELHNFRKVINYSEIAYYLLYISFLNENVCEDIVRYIKILYCKDIHFEDFTGITVI